MSVFTGSGTAIVTPFDDKLSVNYDALGKLIEFQIENGSDAIIICGTTGEASTLTDDEQIEAISFTVKTVNKRIPVIAGAGSNHTEHGAELCKGAQNAGADACLLVTPYYNKTTQKGLIEHFTIIANGLDIPVILYNVPMRTGLNMTPQTMYELSKIENIIGVKEASGDISQVAEIASLCGDGFDIYSGNDDMILPILSLGGKGVISVLANVMPNIVHEMCAAYFAGNTKRATELQLKYIPLINALFSEVNPIPVKAALNLMGMNAGGYRRPLTNMEEAHLAALKKEMKAVGLI